MCSCSRTSTGGCCNWFSFFFLFSQRFVIDCGVVVTRRPRARNNERLRMQFADGRAPFSEALTKSFQLSWDRKANSRVCGRPQRLRELARTQKMRASYTSTMIGSQELFRLLTYFSLYITICELPGFMSSQSNETSDRVGCDVSKDRSC